MTIPYLEEHETNLPGAAFNPQRNRRAWRFLLMIVDGTFSDLGLKHEEYVVLQLLLSRGLVNLTGLEAGQNVYTLTAHGRQLVAHYQMENPAMITDTQKKILETLSKGAAHLDRRVGRASAVLCEMNMIQRLRDGKYDLLPAGSQYLADGTVPERPAKPKPAKPFAPPVAAAPAEPENIWQIRAENGVREIARQQAIIDALKAQLAEAEATANTSASICPPDCLNCEIMDAIQDVPEIQQIRESILQRRAALKKLKGGAA